MDFHQLIISNISASYIWIPRGYFYCVDLFTRVDNVFDWLMQMDELNSVRVRMSHRKSHRQAENFFNGLKMNECRILPKSTINGNVNVEINVVRERFSFLDPQFSESNEWKYEHKTHQNHHTWNDLGFTFDFFNCWYFLCPFIVHIKVMFKRSSFGVRAKHSWIPVMMSVTLFTLFYANHTHTYVFSFL